MTVSIIIPTLNEAAGIANAVANAWDAGADDVVVVDGGSDDGTPEVARQSNCRVFTTDRGRAVQQNFGAERAVGDVLLFLHADCRLAAGAVGQIRAAMDSDRILAGAFHHQIEANGWLFRLIEKGNAWRVRRRSIAYGDQGVFVRRDVFQQIGGFPDVPIMEDLLLTRRLRKLGRLTLLPGPLHISARRWQQNGIVRQTARNWMLLFAEMIGVSPQRLTRFYAPHQPTKSER